MSNTSLSKMYKTDLESIFFFLQKLSSFMKSWIFSFHVGDSHHYTENRFLLGDPGSSIQRAFRLWRWKRHSFPCHWHSVQSASYLLLSVLHSKRHFAVKQWTSIRAAFTEEVVETQPDNICRWHLLRDPFSLLIFFFLRNRVKLFCAIKGDLILIFIWYVSCKNDS